MIRKRLVKNLFNPDKNDAWKAKKTSLFFINDKLGNLKKKLGKLKNKVWFSGHTKMIRRAGNLAILNYHKLRWKIGDVCLPYHI